MDDQLLALADPTRRAILRGLGSGERKAGDIADAFKVSRPAISHHLKVLNQAGLIKMRRQAQARLYSVNADKVRMLQQEFSAFWGEALPRLKAVVEADMQEKREREKHG